jgi:hypothetical protein
MNMNDSPDVAVDVAILGGGIAGLWLLDTLCEAGYSAILLEADALGAGQSVASQGIIHGGTKYTLGLALDTAVRELRAMPETWRASLEGASRPDLSRARTLSQHTYMWVPKQLGGGLLRTFSRLIMRSRVQGLAPPEWPDGLRDPDARGAVYALDEVVLDTPSVLAALRDSHPGRVLGFPTAMPLPSTLRRAACGSLDCVCAPSVSSSRQGRATRRCSHLPASTTSAISVGRSTRCWSPA